MENIKNIVSGIMEHLSSGKGGAAADIQSAWVKVSKDQGSRVADFKEGRVTIVADSSMRLVRLNLNRENLLKELQKEFPAITKIHFKVGTI